MINLVFYQGDADVYSAEIHHSYLLLGLVLPDAYHGNFHQNM